MSERGTWEDAFGNVFGGEAAKVGKEIDDQKEQKEHDDGGPAFPLWCNGMTLLDWFAGKAMQALLGDNELLQDIIREDPKPEENRTHGAIVSECCYDWAEAMVAEKRRREK
jgi:hypothetical protein